MTFLPTGGVYITGGLAPRNSQWIMEHSSKNEGLSSSSVFMNCYRDKGRASSILDDVPLFLVTREDMGLRGAAKCAELELQNYKLRKTPDK
mmetsp:Transcript_27377/g.51351  ORF Transcript_27377/g.51351 Transcript_27377/m.51351 type:complete len:91 (-) Transcript_27377:493-765(-)